MHRELETVLTTIRSLPAEELAIFLGELEALRLVGMQRLLAAAPVPPPQADELLDVRETARRLGVSTCHVYRNASNYSFVRRQGRKLLFSARGLAEYIQQSGEV